MTHRGVGEEESGPDPSSSQERRLAQVGVLRPGRGVATYGAGGCSLVIWLVLGTLFGVGSP